MTLQSKPTSSALPPVAMFSSLSANSGGWLRTTYIGRALEMAGHAITYARPHSRALPKSLDCLLTIPRYCHTAAKAPCKIAVGNKSLPNVLLALRAAQQRGAFAALDIDDLDANMLPPPLRKPFHTVVNFFARRMNLITTHNALLARHIEKEYAIPPDRIYLLEQGVAEPFLSLPDPAAPDPLTLQWKQNRNRILLYVAHMNAASEMGAVLRALKESLAVASNARLVVIGSGVFLEQHKTDARKAGLSEFVNFTGRKPPEHVAAYMALAEICLIYYSDTPYNRMRESMKLREYLAMGRPVVCNTIGNLAAFAPYAYACDNSEESFAGRVSGLIRDASMLDGRETAAQAFIRERFSWERIGSAFSHTLTERMQHSNNASNQTRNKGKAES